MTIERKRRFLELLKPIYPRLSRYALAITRDKDEAKDLVSEAVLVALERFDTLRDEAGFAGFLFRVVARTHKRWHYRERKRVPFNQAYSESLHDAHQLPDKAAEIALVMDALNRLPAKTKETVLLFDLADLSLEDIRVIQGGTLSGVKSRLRRGHEELRSRLGVESQDESEVMVKTATLEVLPSTAGNHVNIMEGMGKYVL